MDPRNPRTLYAGAMEYGCEGPCAFKSTDGAESWVVIGDGRIPPDIIELQVDPVNPNTVYAGTYGSGLFKSEDGGDSWRAILADCSVHSVAVDPSNPRTLYAGWASGPDPVGGVSKSTDGGNTWRALNRGLLARSANIAINPRNPATVYAGTSYGVYRSRDGGESWSAISVGLPGRSVTALTLDPSNPDRLYAGTDGGGVFVYQDSEGCSPNAETLCLNGSRFAATTRWTTRDGRTGSGNAVALTGDTGYFTFFDAANVEMIVKVLNGCGVNSHHWVFAAGLTDVEVVLTVTDSLTGGTFRTYTNPQGAPFQPVQDTSAFSTCP